MSSASTKWGKGHMWLTTNVFYVFYATRQSEKGKTWLGAFFGANAGPKSQKELSPLWLN